MLPSATPSTVDDRHPSAVPRTPRLWVFVALTVIFVVGIATGFHVWDYLGQPGKDPMAQLNECGPAGMAVALLVYVVGFRRTWRLTVPAAVLAFVLGACTGLAAVGLHLYQFGWH